ncbi:hypothetical protein BJX61DRAFT_541008 [Aspergillus egyptiacus]|nr:hypothetical protein BJX61DRAFT_541008 [Aspergillus egyptiacus]
MLPPLLWLLSAVTAGLAQTTTTVTIAFSTETPTFYPPLTLEIPNEIFIYPTDHFVVSWAYNYDYDGYYTITIHDGFNERVTSVWAPDSETTLPPTMLPAVRPGETSEIDFTFCTTTTDADQRYCGITVPDVWVYADTTTTGATETGSSGSTTITITMSETTEPAEISSDGSRDFSTGAKAGIGVGAGLGGLLLLAVGGFFFLHFRRRGGKPETIREIAG